MVAATLSDGELMDYEFAPQEYLNPLASLPALMEAKDAEEVTGYQVVESPKLNLVPAARNKIDLLEMAINSITEDSPDDVPTEHFHAPGLYGRHVTIPADSALVTNLHKTEHITIALKGTFTMFGVDGTLKKVVSPAMWITPAGTKRAIYCHDEVIIANVHPADAETKEEAEAQIYATGWEEFEQMCKVLEA